MSEAATERKGNNLQGFHDFHLGMGKPGPDSGSVENEKGRSDSGSVENAKTRSNSGSIKNGKDRSRFRIY